MFSQESTGLRLNTHLRRLYLTGVGSKNFFDVNVGAKDVKGIEFVQKRYWIIILSPHDLDAYMTHPDSSPVDLKINKDSQYVCVGSPGLHELDFVNSYIFYGCSSMKIDMFKSSPIYLKGEKYLLRGQVNVESGPSNSTYQLPDGIIVNILNGEGTVINSIVARIESNGDEQLNTAIYEYSVWANLRGYFPFFLWTLGTSGCCES
ncbi:hypothetical protein SLEP1_g59142 [Rubroshorea leprosula]|uniref:Uncharacterized protein n=1 Tax=Rubroshorea leprosula TaxID=152421 RepID=A0AAV5MRW9_9ROSI|nr:hypothetical protein SLEP1_g59142 [Rubroshorea leprosula]